MDRKLQKSAPAAAKCPAVIGLGVEAILAAPTFSEMAEGEREFLIEAARVKQIRIKNSERYAKRRAADTLAIEAMANAMVEIADGDLDAVRGCYRVQVAAPRSSPSIQSTASGADDLVRWRLTHFRK